MAERERIPNKERRAQAREERKRQEAEAAERQQKRNWRNGAVTFVIVGVVAAVVFQAFSGGNDSLDAAILVSSSEVEEAREAAGCEVLVDREPLPDRAHVESSNQLDPDAAYPDVRPTHSGSHTAGVHPVVPAAGSQIDEVSSTHNLEHGTVIVWWDPEQAGDAAGGIEDWSETLNASGFRRDAAGVGIITSPYEDPGISSEKAVAFRSWGVAMDCDTWDETVANGFVLDHFGTRGIGPERNAAPFPDDALAYSDRDTEDTSEEEAPTGDEPHEAEEVDPDAGDGDDDSDGS
ncbi:MAG: DUF3105 domain-containing protein [Nitriliruptoraceae bacterium]